jgi:hypothetical protein
MLIHPQNSYAPLSKQRTGRREAQGREPDNKGGKKKKEKRLCEFDMTC